jgi:uncharacterized membrane protein YeaQ/YmgE (transglycosylase-associated protein family)
VGAVVGWLASLVMKTNAQMSAIATIVVGIVGSSLGSGWPTRSDCPLAAVSTAGWSRC